MPGENLPRDRKPFYSMEGVAGTTELIVAGGRVSAASWIDSSGQRTVYFGSIPNAREEATTRIPYGPPPSLDEF